MSAEQGSPFGTRTATYLLIVGGISVVTAVVLWIFGGDMTAFRSHGTDSASRSAIGHRALVELLREVDGSVLVSYHRSGEKAGRDAALIVAEPFVDGTQTESAWLLREMCFTAWTMLVVLPKWQGVPRPDRPTWIKSAALVSSTRVDTLLAVLGIEGALVRPNDVTPGGWDTGSLGFTPKLRDPQLLVSDSVKPLIRCDAGILLAEWEEFSDRFFILSDPDVISNHGLDDGDNARLALRIIDELAKGTTSIVVDETLHGLRAKPSILRELFRIPLALVTIQVILTAAILLLVGIRRFGSPGDPPTDIAPGKEFLVANTAGLLIHSGHAPGTLIRYLESSVRAVAQRLHAPPRLQSQELDSWLERVGRTYGVEIRLSALRHDTEHLGSRPGASHADILSVAARIRRWRREIAHEY